jgi:hypothetical protein
MNVQQATRLGWAEGLLRLVLGPSDRDSISGDLLEEYRLVRRPERGALRANAWCLRTC